MTSCRALSTALSRACAVLPVPFLSWAQNGSPRAKTRMPAAIRGGQQLRNNVRMVSSEVCRRIRENLGKSLFFPNSYEFGHGEKIRLTVRALVLDRLGKEGKYFFLILSGETKFA